MINTKKTLSRAMIAVFTTFTIMSGMPTTAAVKKPAKKIVMSSAAKKAAAKKALAAKAAAAKKAAVAKALAAKVAANKAAAAKIAATKAAADKAAAAKAAADKAAADKAAADKAGTPANTTTVSAIVLGTKSIQSQVGVTQTVTATVTPKAAGIPVTFNVVDSDTTTASLNTPVIKEVMTDANGVASLSYTRYYGSNDSIRAYATSSPTVGDSGYAWWGSQPRLTVATNSTATVQNGNVVTYTVNLKDSNGTNLSGHYLNVLFKENMNASGTSALAGNSGSSSSQITSQNSTLYTRDITGQTSSMNLLTVTTDSNGNASFTVTGSSTTATPVIYETNAASLAAANLVKIDSDKMEIVATPAVFGSNKYTVSVDKATGTSLNATTNSENDYIVTVKNADGTPYSGGTVTVGMNELMNGGSLTTHARIMYLYNDTGLASAKETIAADNLNLLSASNALAGSAYDSSAGGYTKLVFTLNQNGQAEIGLRDNTSANETATPIFWVDSNNNQLVDNSEFSYTAGSYLFLDAKSNGAGLKFYNAAQLDKVTALDSNSQVSVRLRAEDQSGNEYTSLTGNSSVTYTVQNTGANPIRVAGIANESNIAIAGALINGSPLTSSSTIAAGNTATITATVTTPVVWLNLVPNTNANDNSSAQITGQFNVNTGTGTSLYTTPAQTFTWANPNPNTAALSGSVGANTVYTGTIASIVRTGIAGAYGNVFVKLDNGNYMNMPLYSNDIVLQGTDYTNGSYITPQTASYRMSAGDKVQIMYTAGISGGNTWKFVNVDGSEDTTLASTSNTAGTLSAAVATQYAAAVPTPATDAVYTSGPITQTLGATTISVTDGTTVTPGIDLAGLSTATAVANAINTGLVGTLITATASGNQVVLTANTAGAGATGHAGITVSTNTGIFPVATTIGSAAGAGSAIAGSEAFSVTRDFAVGDKIIIANAAGTVTLTAGTTAQVAAFTTTANNAMFDVQTNVLPATQATAIAAQYEAARVISNATGFTMTNPSGANLVLTQTVTGIGVIPTITATR